MYVTHIKWTTVYALVLSLFGNKTLQVCECCSFKLILIKLLSYTNVFKRLFIHWSIWTYIMKHKYGYKVRLMHNIINMAF